MNNLTTRIIKSKELWRIGDICDFHGERVYVIGSSVNSVKVEIRDKEYNDYIVNEANLKPSPIDEKLLIDSGFKKMPSLSYYVRERARFIILSHNINPFVWNVNVDGKYIAKVRYAHELKRIIEALNV